MGATRDDRRIDRIFSSFTGLVEAFGTLDPLENEDGSKKSDHRVAYIEADLPRAAAFEWVTYSYRFYNDEATKLFGKWIVAQNWAAVVQAGTSDDKADTYQKMITDVIDAFFPLITTRKKSTDLPWINHAIRKRIAQRKRLFRLCLLYTSPSPRDRQKSRMPSSA